MSTRAEAIERGWYVANYGMTKRPWFILRETEMGTEYHENKNWEPIRFGTYETARKVADKLNAQHTAH